jgi:hypothetical protein
MHLVSAASSGFEGVRRNLAGGHPGGRVEVEGGVHHVQDPPFSTSIGVVEAPRELHQLLRTHGRFPDRLGE